MSVCKRFNGTVTSIFFVCSVLFLTLFKMMWPLLTRRDPDNINWPGSDLRWLLRAGSASPPSEIRLKKSDKC